MYIIYSFYSLFKLDYSIKRSSETNLHRTSIKHDILK